MAAHLAQCERCGAELERLKKLSRLFGESALPEIPPATLRRLHRSVAEVERRVVVTLAKRLTAAAAVLLILCGGWAWLGPGSDQAVAAPSAWELAAVGLEDDDAPQAADPFAQWLVGDLTLENGNE